MSEVIKQDLKTEALKLALEALEKLWNIIDDIDTYGDMVKADEKLYRSLVERRQRTRFEETGISTDGYTLNGGAITAIREALAEQPAQQQEPVAVVKALPMGHNQSDMHYAECQHLPVGTLLYTSPPASKPLTDEEIWDEVKAADLDWQTGWSLDEDASNRYITFARAIEAAHGIKEKRND